MKRNRKAATPERENNIREENARLLAQVVALKKQNADLQKQVDQFKAGK